MLLEGALSQREIVGGEIVELSQYTKTKNDFRKGTHAPDSRENSEDELSAGRSHSPHASKDLIYQYVN
jgi:hypothetical protein